MRKRAENLLARSGGSMNQNEIVWKILYFSAG